MLSSVLRRVARCHLRVGRFGRSDKERLPGATRQVQRPWGIDRHTARPVALLQGARFSTQGGTRSRPPKHNLVINTAKALPDIYASPVSLLEERFPEIVPLDCTSASILTNGENQKWYTATYIDTSNNEEFHSGTLGGFLERMGAKSQWDAPAFSLEETCVLEGKIHYRSEHAAKQAAAARALDCRALGAKYLRIYPGDSLEPLRYCQEHPYLSPVFGEAAPAFYWSCLMQSKYGPIDANIFDVRTMPDHGAGGAWFTATCIEPKTGETFSAGVFGLQLRCRHTSIPEAPKTSLAFEEMRTFDGEVYYRAEATAKHAAAARAIDCMNHRVVSDGGGDSERNATRLCIEEPYLAPAEDGNRTPADYAEMEEMIAKRRRGVPDFSFSEFMSSGQQDGKSPKALLQSGLEEQYGVKASQTFFLDVSMKDGKRFVSATFIHPVSKEEFRSGILRPDVHLFANLKPFWGDIHAAADGSVWYKRSVNYAIEAAAARALDCYAMRDKRRPDGEMPMQLCMEDPHKEGEAPLVDYASLLAQRDKDLASSSPAFTTFTNSKPYLLHAPKSLLSSAFARANGVELTRQAFDVKELRRGGRWFTATFTDPITQETFSSGLVGKEVTTEKRSDSSINTPLHQAETTVKDGKVYYGESRLAEHAAAARAIDCYLFREGGGEESDLQLCMEDPYKSKDEGASQAIDYDALVSEKRLLVNETTVAAPIPLVPLSLPGKVASLVNSNPYLLHTPKNFLNGAFVGNMRRKAYRVSELQRDGEKWFTATFTDPNTKETFSSGLVGKETTAEMHLSARLYQPLHQAEATVFDGKVYYKDKKLAEHAAAARAIDCYIFREGGGKKSDLQLCMEDPYKVSAEGRLQATDYDALVAEKRLANEGTTVAAPISIPPMPRSVFTSHANAKSYLLHAPKSLLGSAFAKANVVMLTRQAYRDSWLRRDGVVWFTATFTDPNTKETFSAGLVGKEATAEKHASATLHPPLHQAEASVVDGKVYYGEAKLAEHAAAARAIDCYIFREGGGKKSDLQLCMEDPYRSGESQTIDYNALLAQRNEQSSSEDHSVIMSDRAEVRSAMESTVHEIPALELSFVDNPPATASPLSTMGRIAEIWIDAAASGSGSTTAKPFTEHRNADQSLKGILNWYDELDKEPRGEVDARGLAQLCNKILAALGKAVSTLDLEEAANHVDVEGDAKVILDHILSLSSTFDVKNDHSFFGADTFNAYIQCLNPLDPARSAKAATDLLNSMSHREPFEDGVVVLPLPNVGTYNSAMALWALVDGAEGQKGVNDVFSFLESASQGIDDDRRILPNEETFNLLLAVNSKVDGRFSFEQAKLWLGKIQGISESILGEAFVPDADVYTAALTTFSKSTETNPTTEQYGNTWLRHGHPYVSGFKTIDDCASEHAEATDIAEWLIHAEQSGVTPSIDMYEAVIRAWVKTGALREGLLTAETWATRAVQSGSLIRLQTFHPIIAAWAMCQLDRAPDRVAEWTKQLASHTALEPDLTTLSAQIIAWRNVQAGLMEKAEVNIEQWSEDYEMQQDIERVFALAQNCTQYLKEVFADGSVEMKGQQDADALSSMFANAIKSWGSASRFTLRHPSNAVLLNARHGVNEMLKIARLFDATIDNDESEEKAQRLLRVMGDSVSEVLSQLHQIDSAVDVEKSDRQRCYFLDRIGPVEAMMRNYEFYSQKRCSPSANVTSESKATRHRMYGEALKGCAGLKSLADFGHVARICRMIMDNLAWQNEHCPGGGKAETDITDLYVEMARLMQTVVQVPEERMYALTKLHKSARPFFEKKRKSEGSSYYATVDRARLIGAMRMAMGDAALTEEFIQRFDGGPKTNARGNTALAVVDEMLRSE